MSEADRDRMSQQSPQAVLLCRIGETQDMAKTCLSAMTESFMTGCLITIDGGSVVA